jgi:hypothetical protein
MRRNGAACATAQQRVEPLLGLIARFSAERQKFCSATPWSEALNASTVTSPLMVTSSGFWPRPAMEV